MSASSSDPPPIDPSTSALLSSLYAAAEKSESNPKPLIRHTEHLLPRKGPTASSSSSDAGPSSLKTSKSCYKVKSWKTAEFAYRKAASVGVGKDLPTLARGLFTVEDEQAKERILVRGYDKFFNVGEMGWTKVSWRSSETKQVAVIDVDFGLALLCIPACIN